MRGLNERIDSSWNDETSATTQSPGSADVVSRISALPMLPPTCTVLPAAANSAPTSAVVVVLPFVPVTATIGALHRRYATSTSLNTGIAGACTRRTSGLLSGMPGESTATVTCSSASSSSSGGTNAHVRRAQLVERVGELARAALRRSRRPSRARAQHVDAGASAAAEADDERVVGAVEAAAGAIRSCGTRDRAKPRSERTSDASQKRVVTFVSGHPPSSK